MTNYTTLRELQQTTLAITGDKAEVSVLSLVDPDTGKLTTAMEAVWPKNGLRYDAVKFAGKWFLTGDYEYA